MLSHNAVDCAESLSRLLSANGYYLEPVPGTPLWDINRVVSGALDGVNPSAGNLVSFSEFVAADGVSEHSAQMSRWVGVIAQTVSGDIERTQSVVMPLIKSVHADLIAELNAAISRSATPYTIVPDVLPEIFQNSAIQSMTNDFASEPIVELPVQTGFPILTSEQLLSVLTTKVGHLDEAVAAYLAALPEGTVEKVWGTVFGSQSRFVSLTDLLNNQDNPEHRQIVILTFLLARGLLSSGPPEGVNMEANEYKLQLTRIMHQAARSIYRINSQYERQASLGIVVTNYPREARSGAIRVNSASYNKWLSEGGTPEALFGSLMDDRATTREALSAKRDAYASIWAKEERLLQMKAKADNFNRTVSALKKCMVSKITDFDTSETGISLQVLDSRLMTALERVTDAQIADLVTLVRDVVCDVMFPHTHAKKIITNIDNIGKENPTLDIREVALLASIDYIVEWIGMLITVKAATNAVR